MKGHLLRSVLCTVALSALLAARAQGGAGFIGSASAAAMLYNHTVNSTHTATALNAQGTQDNTVRFDYAATILKSDGFTAADERGTAAGTFSKSFSLTGMPRELCFTAYTYASGYFGTFVGNISKEWFSGEVCFPDKPKPEKPPNDNCPIILDLGRDGLHLSGASPAVQFDINADGQPNAIAWTKAGSDDAFLCMDRNHNGRIDDGSELFGHATPLSSGGTADNGFIALADLDSSALGGNEDGVVDSSDSEFGELCLWRDLNRDGISQADEISALSASPVVALDLAYHRTGIRDQFGNEFRYGGHSFFVGAGHGRPAQWPMYDVVFVSAPHQ